MKFAILMKSHTDYSDYEDTCEAENVKEAAEYFLRAMGGYAAEGLTPKDLLPFIHKI